MINPETGRARFKRDVTLPITRLHANLTIARLASSMSWVKHVFRLLSLDRQPMIGFTGMKQTELNKLLNAALKRSAEAHKWKCSRGFVFKATELLLFSIVISGQVKRRHLFYRLGYKLRAFDDLFWKIVKLDENPKQPLSFRAFGVWTVPMTTISKGELSITAWDTENLQLSVNAIITGCDSDAEKVAKEIDGLDDNMRVIERCYLRLKDEYPTAASNIWRERLLTSFLKKDYRDSENIIRERINSHDSGGFQVGNKSFYELANEHLQSLLCADA